MKVLAFDVTGALAHFRKPDTTATQLTYPFITPTAAKGLVGAILGLSDFRTRDRVGIQLLRPVRQSAQQMSMLGKDGGQVFNRPTTIELLVQPGYRIYYAGDEYSDDLHDFLLKEHAVYPTYLGVAFALTKPKLVQVFEQVSPVQDRLEQIVTKTVVPAEIVQDLVIEPDRHYSRAGGFLRQYLGDRTFEKSVDFIYERQGKPMSVRLADDFLSSDVQIVRLGDEYVCLV
ncbi:MAG: CRISPR-associated protein Cas5 [Brevibacillus sp.]|nr:CRISPR-associated protein Cas5 [Brevibacillus sp.]